MKIMFKIAGANPRLYKVIVGAAAIAVFMGGTVPGRWRP